MYKNYAMLFKNYIKNFGHKIQSKIDANQLNIMKKFQENYQDMFPKKSV